MTSRSNVHVEVTTPEGVKLGSWVTRPDGTHVRDGEPPFASDDLVQMLLAFHRKGVSTVPAAMVLIEAVCAESAGKPHNLRSLQKVVRVPYSSVSRITFQLVELGLLSLEHKAGDRRVKFIRANLKAFGRLLPPVV